MHRLYVVALLLTLLAVTYAGSARMHAAPAQGGTEPARIVSLAPSITETVCALGLEKRLVGITQYCSYPPEIQDKARVAGFSEAYYEAIVHLNPDLVLLPRDKDRIAQDLRRLGLHTLEVDTLSLQGFLQSITAIGQATGTAAAARTLLCRVQTSIRTAQERAAQGTPPRVLLCVAHDLNTQGELMQVTAIGQDGFYDELLRAAGGRNAYTGALPYPRLSQEALARLAPDIVIAVAPQLPDATPQTVRREADALRAAWRKTRVGSTHADPKVIVLTDRAVTVPGPRVADTLTELSRLLFPSTPAVKS